jgi:16S rRNA processing protein RimM
VTESTRVTIGRVGRPHGLDGAFVVEAASDAAERWAPGSELIAAGEPARVVESKRSGGRLVVRLDRPVDRGAALEVDREALPEPEGDDTFYAFELVGLAVDEQGGRRLGHVREVVPGTANDVLQLDSGIALPFAESCVLDVDLKGRCILVSTGFADPEDA